jgi:hypothetical protein
MARRRFGSLFRHPDHAQVLAKALGRRVEWRLVLGYQLSEKFRLRPQGNSQDSGHRGIPVPAGETNSFTGRGPAVRIPFLQRRVSNELFWR